MADIGGTNTRMALARDGQIVSGSLHHERNRDWSGLGPLLAAYLKARDMRPDLCCVAVAGPVQEGRAELTNIDWTIRTSDLARHTGARDAVLLNDLQAQGHALGHVAPAQIRTVVEGPVVRGAPMLVVGLGTGVNAAPVHDSGAGRVVLPSECGHVNMPAMREDEFALARYIERQPGAGGRVRHAGVEEVLSGRGPGFIHGFLAARAGQPERAAVDSHMVLDALARGDRLARETVALYVRILGRFLGDLALIHLPFGGIFLIGGMARAMTPHFDTFGLTAVFRAPRWIDMLDNAFRISVVEDDDAALVGCAAFMAQESGAAASTRS